MSSKCPKCGGKIKTVYMKQACPHCGVNMLYYKLDEQLKADAEQAQKEVDAVNRFTAMLKASTVQSPWHIVRLVLFFTPLASMCLPLYRAGHKTVSLISFIMSIINHGFDVPALAADKSYLFSVLAMVMVIVLSLAVIISSLFSSAQNGLRRNLIFSTINAVVLTGLSAAVVLCGGALKRGIALTFAIYAAEIVLHYVCDGKPVKKGLTNAAALLCIAVALETLIYPAGGSLDHYRFESTVSADVTVVSFNTAAPWGTPFDDTKSADRAERFAAYITAVQPDLIGTQELNTAWLDAFSAMKENEPESVMTDYEWYAVKRGGDSDENTSEMNGIFWRTDQYTAVETNTFWLSDTPKEESRYTYFDENGEQQEAGCNRICSYAVLQNRDGGLLVFMNTHLDNASEQAMNFGAHLIVKYIEGLREHYGEALPIVLTGDFNQTSDGEAYRILSSALNDTTEEAKQTATYQQWGYRSTGDKPIDFIFTSGSAQEYQVLDELPYGYVSDHYGVFAAINF